MELKTRLEIIKEIGNILKSVSESEQSDKLLSEDERIIFMDCANVCGIIPKTEKAKQILLQNYEYNSQYKIPKLDYHSAVINSLQTCKFSSEYLSMIIKIARYYLTIELSLLPEYPLKIEVKDFIFILAPRVTNE